MVVLTVGRPFGEAGVVCTRKVNGGVSPASGRVALIDETLDRQDEVVVVEVAGAVDVPVEVGRVVGMIGSFSCSAR